MPSIEELVSEWHNEQPHPQAPGIKVGEFPVAARLATMLKFGQGHASPQEATNFWHEFQAMNQNLVAQKRMPVAPEEFTHLVSQMSRSSFAYHGRPPSMYEIARLRDADPQAIHAYFGALPDEHYPTISAADMAKTLHAARPWANQYAGRDPVKLEAAYLYSSGHSPAEFYRTASGRDDQAGGQSGTASSTDAGRQQNDPRTGDPRVAPRTSSSGGAEGVSAR